MKPLQANSQCSRILGHLMRHRTITRAQAFDLYGASNLWQRIAELEKRGHDIRHEPRVKVGHRQYVTRYRLVRK